MKTPYLDNEINFLESSKNKGEISLYGLKKLEEYKSIKEKLSSVPEDEAIIKMANGVELKVPKKSNPNGLRSSAPPPKTD